MSELNTADSQVVTSRHRRSVSVVLDLLVFTAKVQKFKEVVIVKEDVLQTANEVLLAPETCQSRIT